MGCIPGKQQKLQIQVIKSNKILSNINENNNIDEKENICIYKQKTMKILINKQVYLKMFNL